MILSASDARAIAAGRKSMHALPFRDDPALARRLVVGASLPVQPQARRCGRLVSLPALCRVVLRDVSFGALGDIGFDGARGCGFKTTDEFRVAWVERYDVAWLNGGTQIDEPDVLGRFDRRHADRTAWLLTFELDKTHRPRLLAARSDELYTENPARALGGEGEAVDALTLEEFARVNAERHALRRAGVADQLLSEEHAQHERLRDSVRLAAERGVDVRDDLRVIERRLEAMRRKINEQRRAA